MSTQTLTHFTAWLVNDPSCLDQGCMDITILEDAITGYREGGYDPEADQPGEVPVWSTDSSKPRAFYAVTTIDARDGNATDGIDQAETLMEQAGWTTVGEWDAVDNAYIVTVERDA